MKNPKIITQYPLNLKTQINHFYFYGLPVETCMQHFKEKRQLEFKVRNESLVMETNKIGRYCCWNNNVLLVFLVNNWYIKDVLTQKLIKYLLSNIKHNIKSSNISVRWNCLHSISANSWYLLQKRRRFVPVAHEIWPKSILLKPPQTSSDLFLEQPREQTLSEPCSVVRY